MNKKIFILIAAGLVVIAIFMLILVMALEQRREELENPTPTVTPTPTDLVVRGRRPTNVPTVAGGQPLTVVDTSPADGATNVPINGEIIISMNKSFGFGDFIFAMAPDTEFRMTGMVGNKAKITFPNGLQAGTIYTYKVNTLEQLPRTFTFTTAGPTPELLPNTYPTGAAEIEEDFMIREQPDVFLRNKTPYEQAEFAVTSVYDEGRRDFVFTVTAKIPDRTAANNAFRAWLQSLGMSNEAIGKLSVTYR